MSFVPASLRLRTAVEVMRRGGVVACPTEAVWGLSCDPQREEAVRHLLQLKRRPVAKGLILVAATPSQLGFLLEGLPLSWLEVLAATWPGASTWLIPHRGRVPPWVHGSHETVAVRVSAHPVVRALCLAWGGALVSTSANPGGARPPVAAFQVRRYFGHALDSILPGAVGGSGRPTVIRDLATGRVIRI